MAAISIPSGSQISPATERTYHQSNLIGDWKGVWSSKDHQFVEFKVVNIRGAKAQVEYTHNGHTERGLADVDGATITFGDVTIGTKDGKNAALEFSVSGATKSAILAKVDTAADQNKLVGSWSGFSSASGQSAFFQVVSIDGRDAQVKFTANGGAMQSGAGIVSKNSVMFGSKATFTSDDGQTGKIIFQAGHSTYAVPVTKNKATSTSSSAVNKVV